MKLGIFTSSLSPSELIIPYIAEVLQLKDDKWYRNFTEGLQYECPPIVDLIRVVIFTALGYLINTIILLSFENDSFWGWSIGIFDIC